MFDFCLFDLEICLDFCHLFACLIGSICSICLFDASFYFCLSSLPLMIPARPDQESVVHLCLLLTEKHAPVMILRTTIHHPTIPDGFLKVFPSLSSRAASTTNMQKPSVAMIHVRPQSMSQFHIIFGNIYHYVNIITPCALQFQIKVW